MKRIFRSSKKRTKLEVYRFVEKLNIDVKNWTFFTVLGYKFLSLSQFLWGQKIQYYFDTASPGTCRSVFPTLRQYQKGQLVLNFPDVATHSSPKIQSQFFHLGFNGTPSTCTRLTRWRICGFVPCITILIVQNFWKEWYEFWFTSIFNSYFSGTRGVISSIQIWKESKKLEVEDSIEKSTTLIPASESK